MHDFDVYLANANADGGQSAEALLAAAGSNLQTLEARAVSLQFADDTASSRSGHLCRQTYEQIDEDGTMFDTAHWIEYFATRAAATKAMINSERVVPLPQERSAQDQLIASATQAALDMARDEDDLFLESTTAENTIALRPIHSLPLLGLEHTAACAPDRMANVLQHPPLPDNFTAALTRTRLRLWSHAITVQSAYVQRTAAKDASATAAATVVDSSQLSILLHLLNQQHHLNSTSLPPSLSLTAAPQRIRTQVHKHRRTLSDVRARIQQQQTRQWFFTGDRALDEVLALYYREPQPLRLSDIADGDQTHESYAQQQVAKWLQIPPSGNQKRKQQVLELSLSAERMQREVLPRFYITLLRERLQQLPSAAKASRSPKQKHTSNGAQKKSMRRTRYDDYVEFIRQQLSQFSSRGLLTTSAQPSTSTVSTSVAPTAELQPGPRFYGIEQTPQPVAVNTTALQLCPLQLNQTAMDAHRFKLNAVQKRLQQQRRAPSLSTADGAMSTAVLETRELSAQSQQQRQPSALVQARLAQRAKETSTPKAKRAVINSKPVVPPTAEEVARIGEQMRQLFSSVKAATRTTR
eukprot:TRINITY_DN6292_c0_g1_i1.p1 TRINITY_DN6292_c0_g1~~TRINITY_DN6292_c0_g1_i1.p1  ORF type:complete len:581 (+),score=145.93 TRINITY_DN6292_c0_g1_i1:102-1844(+)